MNKAANLFRSLDPVNEMSEPEAAVYRLKIERDALLGASQNYHRDRVYLQRFIERGPEQDRKLQRLNETYPLGYARKELDAVNRAIAKAVTDLNNYQADNLKDGQHLNTRKYARRSWQHM